MTKQENYTFEIKIPKTIQIKNQNNSLVFVGPLGSTGINLEKIDPTGSSAIFLDQASSSLKILTSSKSYSGLIKKLILNKMEGISRGFLIYLKIVGIGYRAHLEQNTLFLKLGYSHDIIYNVPSSIKIFLLDPTLLCLFGIDKNQLTQIASNLRKLRKPSVYKGKGIRLLDEKINIKTGKRK
jgi:large subunit ribosomal protein L6